MAELHGSNIGLIIERHIIFRARNKFDRIFLRHMATLSTLMLRNAVRALDEADPVLARDVLDRDKQLDEEFASALRQLMSFAMEDQQFLRATVDTVFALKGLERIGDHAKNVAEQVLYLVEGERPRKKGTGDRG